MVIVGSAGVLAPVHPEPCQPPGRPLLLLRDIRLRAAQAPQGDPAAADGAECCSRLRRPQLREPFQSRLHRL